jgi:hypothetical protein
MADLIALDENLGGGVNPMLVDCTFKTDSILKRLFSACQYNDNDHIKKETVLAIVARTYETFYVAALLIQMQAGATLGLNVRSILECAADIVGFAEYDNYWEVWIGKEKDQWKSMLNAVSKLVKDGECEKSLSGWSNFVNARLQDIENSCLLDNINVSYESLPSRSDREKLLMLADSSLALSYKFLCVDAHNRPTSVLGHHAPNAKVEIFLPTGRNFLDHYLTTMLRAWGVIGCALSKIWVSDDVIQKLTAELTETIGKAVNEAHAGNSV